jgi:hypothetical protein
MKDETESRIVTNLKEFFEATDTELDEASMWRYGRNLYKYTFGPWVAYTIELEPETDQDFSIVITPDAEGNCVFEYAEDTPQDMRTLFKTECEVNIPFSQYCDLVDNYKPAHPVSWRGEFVIFPTPKLTIQGRHPTKAIHKSVYYEDDDAVKGTLAHLDSCVSITVGSIVEGSDVELCPRYFDFPFEMKVFYDGVEDLGREVAFYWKRDNAIYYKVSHPEEEPNGEYCQWVQFDDDPQGSFDEADLPLVKAAGDVLWDTCMNEGERKPVPGFDGWEVEVVETPDITY